MRYPGLIVLLALAVSAFGVPARAQEVGQVDRAEGALKTFEERTSALAVKEPVRIGLTVSLPEKRSFVDVGLDVPVSISDPAGRTAQAASFHSQGPHSAFTIEEARLGEDGGKPKLLLGLKIDRGTLWMALSQLVLHQVWIRTPELTAHPRGTSFRILVDPVVGTFVATDEGEVRAELPGGEVFLVTAGHWLLVPPGGAIQRGTSDSVPGGLDEPPLLDCCDLRTDQGFRG
jgi:hypothetical protein